MEKMNKSYLIILILMAVPLLGCITMSYFFDFDQDNYGKGTLHHSFSFPMGDDSSASSLDSYIQSLTEQGWEDIQIGVTDDGLGELKASYKFDFSAGRYLPGDFANVITITFEETPSGDTLTSFDAIFDFSQMQNNWKAAKELVNSSEDGVKVEFKFIGFEQTYLTKEEFALMVRQYGEPKVIFNVRLPGNVPAGAEGPWSNAGEYMSGKTDTITFLWTVNQHPHVTLHVSRFALIEEVEEEVEEITPAEESVPDDDSNEETVGMPCDQYCLSLNPTGFWLDGENYPECTCDCGPGNTFFGQKCLVNSEICAKDGMRLYRFKDGDSNCLCTDPTKKFDMETQSCINLDGSECRLGNGCEIHLGENCSNCPDCGCSFGSDENRQYDHLLSCNPSSPYADIFGCVYNIPEKSEQLEIMKEEWNQCRDAWALLNLASNFIAEEYGAEVMGAFSDLGKVQVWQQKSGCIPIDDMVIGHEAVDPMICLMRYCDQIKTGIHEMERQINGNTPVIYGPAIKINLPNISFTSGQVYQLNNQVSIFGDRPASLNSPIGAGFAHSIYQIVYDPEIGMDIHLFEGSFTYTYYDPVTGTAKQEILTPGEMLSVNKLGVPEMRRVFDPADIDRWWDLVDYFVECPENSSQVGPDCFCNTDYEVDDELEQCVPLGTLQLDYQSGESIVGSDFSDGSGILTLFCLCCCCWMFLLFLFLLVIFIIILRKRKHSQEILYF